MKKLINSVENVLNEQLRGFTAAHPEIELRLDPTFLVQSAGVGNKVALISGGGSGHEPMHAGFIGKGMLAGAIPGEIFTSPTPDQIIACSQAADGGKGVLLIVKNYTGDVLNFETATELLQDMGCEVSFVLSDDDVAVKDSLYTAGRRGVANTVIMEKILGAAAETGDDLSSLTKLGIRVNNNGFSIGVALNACTVPSAGKPSFTLAEDEMEFGVGIHGEPGISRRPYQDLNDTVDQMFQTLLENGTYSRTIRTWNGTEQTWEEHTLEKQPLTAGDRVIAMVNNLGSVPISELYGIYGRLAENCQKANIHIERSLVGSYCTSLDMQGFSITLTRVDDELLRYFDAPVSTPAWKQ
ncbi:dihydroxyacetone kinase subunit DhaK [Suttonella ornithocola]|uniref:phosphoenolpyruvate--glycerone phosphotransferase n=1 Tax=Suttonella ornithocola TaxID=279832 RepID=A0A380MYX3_9GAMM|nr:dihydroxyacetone kinase subunit DhaK [Suttonella ornithocola]SUO97749.1 PTS-dependent dihydroxyacetone kinase, dihydroxyacetone-binding subunit dhaK [Suttonella ornithocola]